MRRATFVTLILTLFFSTEAFGQGNGLTNGSSGNSSETSSGLTRYDGSIATLPLDIRNKLQQPNTVLTFDECALIAVSTSFSVQEAELTLQQRSFGYQASLAGLKSYVNLDMILPEYKQETEEEYNYDTGQLDYFTVKSDEQNSTLKFAQPLRSNGEISGNIIANRFKEGDYSPEYTNRLDLRFNQPIMTPNKLQIDIFESHLDLEKSKIDYISSRVSLIYGYGFRTGMYSSFGRGRESLSNYYYNLYNASRTLELRQEKYSLLQDLLALTEQRHEAGDIPESEYLLMRVETTSEQTALNRAQTDYESSKRNLVQFLGIDTESDFEVVPEIPYQPLIIDREFVLDKGISNNTGIRGFLIELKQDSLSIITTRENGRKGGRGPYSEFQGSISASLGLNKTADSYKLYYDDFNNSQSFALNLSAPVWDGGRIGLRVSARETEYELKKRQLRNDILDTKRQILGNLYTIEMMQERIELIRRALVTSEAGLNIAVQQFRNGSISTEDILLSVNKNFEAKTEYLGLLMDYRSTMTELTTRTQWDFENNVSIRESIEKLIEQIL